MLKYENDNLFSEHALKRLKDGYMRDDETSPQQRFRFVADSFGSNKEHSDRIYEYASNLWLSFSTPLLAYGKNKNALPISCFLSNIEDSKESLLNKSTETRMLSMLGGGIGLGFGIRPRGEKSTGIFPHIKTYDADTIAWKQGSTRRGAIATYLDVNHPEIQEFISIMAST
jgi:ribonucleoside-diphosphate reductase alpha chain